jgi:LysM repeat protein
MSAALALDIARPLPGDRPSGLPYARPQLRLVPTGPDVATIPVRMTRRGRLVRTVLAVAVALAVAWSVVTAVTAGAAGPQVVTVTKGQTLSEIAARQLPDVPVRDAVAAFQLANGLNSSDIHAGQVLRVPVAR